MFCILYIDIRFDKALIIGEASVNLFQEGERLPEAESDAQRGPQHTLASKENKRLLWGITWKLGVGEGCTVYTRDVRGRAFSSGEGEDKNPRGGAKVKIRGAGRGGAKKRVNWLIKKYKKVRKLIF